MEQYSVEDSPHNDIVIILVRKVVGVGHRLVARFELYHGLMLILRWNVVEDVQIVTIQDVTGPFERPIPILYGE